MNCFLSRRSVTVLLLAAASTAAAANSRAPLADAVEKMDGPKIPALLKELVDVNAPQDDGTTAFHWHVYNKQVAKDD